MALHCVHTLILHELYTMLKNITKHEYEGKQTLVSINHESPELILLEFLFLNGEMATGHASFWKLWSWKISRQQKFQWKNVTIKRRKTQNCRPMFGLDSCLRALFTARWREVEPKQNPTVSLHQGCKGQAWRRGRTLRNKREQNSTEEGHPIFAWGSSVVS